MYCADRFTCKCELLIAIQNSKQPQWDCETVCFESHSAVAFPHDIAKQADRMYFSSTTVEGMKNQPWWSHWHGCLFSLSVSVIPPAADSSKMKASVPGFTDTLSKIVLLREKMKTVTRISDYVVRALIYHGRVGYLNR